MNYSVSSSSPTDELLTLGQIFSEVRDYASTILDREHLSLSHRCETRLDKVVDELVSRNSIQSAENLYDIPEEAPLGVDLKSLSISELHGFYRRWPLRHNERCVKGRESFSFYYEGTIVREIRRRKATNKAEQFKIDYCTAMYGNELSNMSDLFLRPVQVDNDKIFPESERVYSPEELSVLIFLYKDYRDIIERELLVEYVDLALDLLEKKNDTVSCLGLLTEVAELGRRETIRIPGWVSQKLEDAIGRSSSADRVQDLELASAMLTMHIINQDPALERKAQRIINRCYKSAFDRGNTVGKRIENLNISVTCSDYVSRFSVRKVAVLWNELSDTVITSEKKLNSKHIYQMLEIAKECEGYALVSTELKNKLKQMLDSMATSDSPESLAYSKIAKLRF